MGDEVTENADQLLQLGQQILDTLVAAYVPAGDDDHALALFPGQAVPDTLVQTGSTNVLRLSEWVAGSYDFPLELALAGGTSLATTVQSGPTLRSAYVTAVRFGVPVVAADAPSRPRLETLISDARRAIGSGTDAVLGFTVDPEDFLEPGHVWNTFDTTITTHAEQSTTTTTAPGPPRRVDPRLWKLRALPDEVVEDLPRRVRFRDRRLATSVEVQQARPEQLAVLRRSLLQPAPEPGPEVVLASVTPEVEGPAVLAPGALTLALRPELDLGLQTERLVAAAEPVGLVTSSARVRAVRSWAGRAVDAVPDRVRVPPREVVAVDAGLAGELATVSLPDLESAPSTTTVTTADTALHVHLEHLAVTIKRKGTSETWWDPELLTDPDWYVPGMRAGDLVAAADDAGTTTCEPLQLLLVRNLSLTGTWNATASGLMTGVHYVGPFLMQLGSSSQADSSQQTVVLGQGTQVIGMVCGPLAPVPPTTDPLLVPAAGPVTPAG